MSKLSYSDCFTCKETGVVITCVTILEDILSGVAEIPFKLPEEDLAEIEVLAEMSDVEGVL